MGGSIAHGVSAILKSHFLASWAYIDVVLY